MRSGAPDSSDWGVLRRSGTLRKLERAVAATMKSADGEADRHKGFTKRVVLSQLGLSQLDRGLPETDNSIIRMDGCLGTCHLAASVGVLV